MTLPRRCVSLLLIYCFAVALHPASPHALANPSRIARETSDEDEGLRFRLSEGTKQPEAHPATNRAPATTLSDVETEAVLKRFRRSRVRPATKQTSRSARSHCHHHAPASLSCSHFPLRTKWLHLIRQQRDHSRLFATLPKATCLLRRT